MVWILSAQISASRSGHLSWVIKDSSSPTLVISKCCVDFYRNARKKKNIKFNFFLVIARFLLAFMRLVSWHTMEWAGKSAWNRLFLLFHHLKGFSCWDLLSKVWSNPFPFLNSHCGLLNIVVTNFRTTQLLLQQQGSVWAGSWHPSG